MACQGSRAFKCACLSRAYGTRTCYPNVFPRNEFLGYCRASLRDEDQRAFSDPLRHSREVTRLCLRKLTHTEAAAPSFGARQTTRQLAWGRGTEATPWGK